MPIEVCTIGGYSEFGKNSTAIKIDEEVIILDMGLHMENYIRYTEDEDISVMSYEELLNVNAVPNYSLIEEWKDKVKAVIPSHGHLDHVGAIPFSIKQFPQASLICTPYTAEVIKSISSDENMEIANKIIALNLNSIYKISKNISVELVSITHSIPHASLVVLHTPYGKIIYANDYKFDQQPILGKKPDFERLKQLGKEGVLLLIVECIYAGDHKKTPSEAVAKQMLKDVMLGVHAEGKGMLVTTFSSHIARLQSIIELGQKLNRKIIFLGRSLAKYIEAAENINLVNFQKSITLVKHKDKMEKILRKVTREGKEKYLMVVTGHQGEPKAILSRMVRDELNYPLSSGDVVIFSCSVIPAELNKENRDKLERALKNKGVRIFRDIHVSGHASREDHRDFIELVKPKHIIPSHAGAEKAHQLAELAEEMGYHLNKNVHVMENGKKIVIK